MSKTQALSSHRNMEVCCVLCLTLIAGPIHPLRPCPLAQPAVMSLTCSGLWCPPSVRLFSSSSSSSSAQRSLMTFWWLQSFFYFS